MLTSGSASPAGARQLFLMSWCFLRSRQHAWPSQPGQRQRGSPDSSPGHWLTPPRICSTSFIPSAPRPLSVPPPRGVTDGGDPQTALPRGCSAPGQLFLPCLISPSQTPRMGEQGGSRSLKPFGLSRPLGKLFLMRFFGQQDQRDFAMGGGYLIFYQVPWKMTFWQGSPPPAPQFGAPCGVTRNSV